MAPAVGGKRKRGDRTCSHDSREETSRPSPHRPGNLSLGQQNYPQNGHPQYNLSRDSNDHRGAGRRRGSRGGRGGGPQRSPINSPNSAVTYSRSYSGPPKTMSSQSLTAQQSSESSETAVFRTDPPTSPVTNQKPEAKPASISMYNYEYIIDEHLSTWEHSGREAVINVGLQACRDEDSLVLGSLFQELIRSYLDGRIDAAEAGSSVKSIIEQNMASTRISSTTDDLESFDASSLFLNCVSIITETSSTSSSILPLLLATDISPMLMRYELDSTLLENLGMIRNTFVRVGIRQQTNLLYRQSNYNLLREETEGYSKLITELFATSSSEPLTSEVVEETFERVKGMIGAFDLDVGRVLDITLDVFAAVLVKQYRFFVKYLRASSWWPQPKIFDDVVTNLSFSTLPKWALPGSSGRPVGDDERDELAHARDERDKVFWERVREIGINAFFEIGGRRVQGKALEITRLKDTASNSPEFVEDQKWIEATGTLPPSGNKVAAQVLGFKLRFYSSSARSPTDVLPVNLVYLAALLIKIGFISLRDLYPHLWPAEEAMEGVREERMKENAEREKLNRPGGGTVNALMAAGALIDDTPAGRQRETERQRELEANRNNTSKVEVAQEKATPPPQLEETEELPEPTEQKIQLLKSLLCIGALPESLYMLGRFPWLPEAVPDLAEHIHRILHHCLHKVYEPLRPLKERPGLREQQKIPDPDQSAVSKGQIRLIEAPARKILRWAQLDKDDTNEAIDYRFYWDDWADNIPVCQSIDDVFSLCSTLVNYSGVKIGQDTALLLKLARIGNHSLAMDSSDVNTARWIDLSKRLIVPALSLTKCNPGVVNEVFELIKNFPTTVRYSIYTEWYSGQVSRLSDIKTAFEQAKAETKDVLKRISKTSVKPMARALAKVAYASPGVVFAVAIAQIESYDNLVETVVECARYFTYLGYDVLTWSLMSSLGGRGRTRVQADGMLTSRWLAALSLFAGKVFKRYSVMSPTPILQYVAEQLRQSNSTDLIVLEEITNSMAGIVSDTNFNESQVLSMAGGELLQAQTMLQLLDRRHESKTTSRRLIRSLVEPKLAGQILISIAQERQTCVYKIPEPDAHLKLLGNLFDELHRVLIQYLDLLRSNLSIKDFDSLVPGVAQLINDFGIEPSIAFWISRPSIAAAMAEHETTTIRHNSWPTKSPAKDVSDGLPEVGVDVLNEDEGLKDINDSNSETGLGNLALPITNRNHDPVLDLEMNNADGPEVNPATPPAAKVDFLNQPWHPVLRDIMDSIRPALPEEKWEILSRPFYVTFWQLSLRDMLVPTQSYDDEITRQKKKILAINSDRTDISIAGTQKKEREKKAVTDLQDRLRAELKDQVQAYSQTRSRLQKEKEHWFSGLWGKWDALNIALIERCFFPRILLSSVDALYAFKMLKFLHSSGATNFRTLGVLDQLFKEKRLTSMLFLCTAKEAENFGRFLNEVLRDLSRWHADKSVFEKEAFGTKKDLPGFSKKMTNEKTILSFWDYEEFRRVLLKWHRNLNTAIKACISSGEYMHIRNAINLLKAVYQYFPAVNWMGQGQVSSIMELIKSESREDLKIAATSLLGNLKRREKDWVLPQAFNLTESASNGISGARAGSAKPATPQPDGGTSKSLNPKAVDFLPGSQPAVIVNGKPTRTALGRLEVEDGEIEDAKHLVSAAKGAAPAMVDASARPKTIQELTIIPPEAIPSKPSEPSILSHESITHQATGQTSSEPETALHSIVTYPIPLEPNIKPNPIATTIPVSDSPRPELNRGDLTNTISDRVQHNLPDRPEPPSSRMNDQRPLERPGERVARDHGRDPRFAERSRIDRSGDIPWERTQDHSMSGSYPRLYDQSSERLHIPDRSNRIEPGWGDDKLLSSRTTSDDRHSGLRRDSKPPSRDDRMERPQRDRSFPESQHHLTHNDFQGPSTRDPAMAPPRSTVPQHSSRVQIHGSQEASLSSINNHPDRRSDASRYENYLTSDRSSRGTSPSRGDDRRLLRTENRRDDHSQIDSRHITDNAAHSHASRHDSSHLPTGPRTDRPHLGGPSNSIDRFRDYGNVISAANVVTNSNHGRLGHDPSHHSRQEESQYGRLNAGPEIPSGPRLSNGSQAPSTMRGEQSNGASQPRISSQQLLNSSHIHPPTLNISDKQASSTLSTRNLLRTSTTFSRPDPTSSAPPTPVNEPPDTAGVHPDRLKAIQGMSSPMDDSQNQGSILQTKPTLATATPTPAGPRAPNNQPPSPVGLSPTNRGPPTGPAFAHDRRQGDKRFAGLQNMLQQANVPNGGERSGQGASIRGRGGRANNVNIPPPMASGSPAASSGRPDLYASRADLFAGRSSGTSTPQHNEEDSAYGRAGRRGGREMAREGETRPERHRSTRSHSRERALRPPAMPREEELPLRRDDLRERPGARPPLEREMRRSGRDDLNHDRRGEPERRDMTEWGNSSRGGPGRDDRDRRDGGGSMRKRGRVGDEGPNERSYAESKRPRRTN